MLCWVRSGIWEIWNLFSLYDPTHYQKLLLFVTKTTDQTRYSTILHAIFISDTEATHWLVGGYCLLEGWCNAGPSTSIGLGFVICSRSRAAMPESVSGITGKSPHFSPMVVLTCSDLQINHFYSHYNRKYYISPNVLENNIIIYFNHCCSRFINSWKR